MFVLNGLQLFLLVGACLFVGAIIGFFLACMLAVSGDCSRQEEQRQWPGSLDEYTQRR